MTLVRLLCDLARRYPRYGYRMLHQMVVRQWIQQGRQEKLNVKTIRRLCRKYGLTLPRRKARKRRGQQGLLVRQRYKNSLSFCLRLRLA